MKKISVIVPIYNTEKYIENFIKSVINQTYKDFELLLINDGSTDDSVKVIEKTLKDNNHIEYKIINKKNRRTIKCKEQRNPNSYWRMDLHVGF